MEGTSRFESKKFSSGMLKKVIFSIFLATFFSIFFVKAANALTLIPPSLEVDLIKGQTYQTSVKLFNEEEKQLTLYSSTANFGAKDETGNPGFNFNAPIEGLSSWIQVDKGPFVIKAGERIEIPIKIITPANAEPGGQYSAVFFSENPPDKAQIAIGSKLGVLVLARVAGEVVEKGSIKEFMVDTTAGMLRRLPINFIIRYENTGNVHLRPTGNVLIKNMWGHEVANLEVNPEKGATLPKTIRRYDVTWESKNTFVAASGNPWQQFWKKYSNEKKNLAYGKYTAKLDLTAGVNDGVVSTSAITFWIFPWHIILVDGVILIAIIVLLILLIRQYNKWLIKRAMVLAQKASQGEKNVKKKEKKTDDQIKSESQPTREEKPEEQKKK